MVGTAKSVLTREVSFILGVLYTEVPLYYLINKCFCSDITIKGFWFSRNVRHCNSECELVVIIHIPPAGDKIAEDNLKGCFYELTVYLKLTIFFLDHLLNEWRLP